jgi:hypothetical protein
MMIYINSLQSNRYRPEYENEIDKLRGGIIRLEVFRFEKDSTTQEYLLIVVAFNFVCDDRYFAIGNPVDVNVALSEKHKIIEKENTSFHNQDNERDALISEDQQIMLDINLDNNQSMNDEDDFITSEIRSQISDENMSSAKSDESCFAMRAVVQDNGINILSLASNESSAPMSPPRDVQQTQNNATFANGSNIIQSGLDLVEQQKSLNETRSNNLLFLLDATALDKQQVDETKSQQREVTFVGSPVLLNDENYDDDDQVEYDSDLDQPQSPSQLSRTTTPNKRSSLGMFDQFRTQLSEQDSGIDSDEMMRILEEEEVQKSPPSNTTTTSPVTKTIQQSPQRSDKSPKDGNKIQKRRKQQQQFTCNIDLEAWTRILLMWKRK